MTMGTFFTTKGVDQFTTGNDVDFVFPDTSTDGHYGNDIVQTGGGGDFVDESRNLDGVLIFGDERRNDPRVAWLDGSDILTGSQGNDIIVGGYGNDTIRGGAGNDTIEGDYDIYQGLELLPRDPNGGRDLIIGGPGADTL